MRFSNVVVLATGVAAANYEASPITSYSTSTQYLTATVTLTQCNSANPECPLYTPPPTTSSSIVTTSSVHTSSSSSSSSSSVIVSYPVHNTTSSTTKLYPTTHYNSTIVHPTGGYPTTAPQLPTTTNTVPAQPTTTLVPVGAAGALSAQSGLLMGVIALGAALFA